MKRLFPLASTLFLVSPVSAAEITSRVIDSVQLTVDGPAVQSTRIGSSYSVSGSNIDVTTLGGLTGGSSSAAATVSAGDYDVATSGSPFAFSETITIGDDPVSTQNSSSNAGRFDAPNLYSESITNGGGTAGDLAGSLSTTGAPTVTAGGPGTTAIGQRTMELTVFN